MLKDYEENNVLNLIGWFIGYPNPFPLKVRQPNKLKQENQTRRLTVSSGWISSDSDRVRKITRG